MWCIKKGRFTLIDTVRSQPILNNHNYAQRSEVLSTLSNLSQTWLFLTNNCFKVKSNESVVELTALIHFLQFIGTQNVEQHLEAIIDKYYLNEALQWHNPRRLDCLQIVAIALTQMSIDCLRHDQPIIKWALLDCTLVSSIAASLIHGYLGYQVVVEVPFDKLSVAVSSRLLQLLKLLHVCHMQTFQITPYLLNKRLLHV